jgi:hypothetical protein
MQGGHPRWRPASRAKPVTTPASSAQLHTGGCSAAIRAGEPGGRGQATGELAGVSGVSGWG